MSIPVLVFTATPGFGALIQQTLEDGGRYKVSLTADPSEVLVKAKDTALAIVDTSDADLNRDDPVYQLGKQVKEQNSTLRLVIVPPENNPEHPIMRELRADGMLTKPFYLPELAVTVEEALQGWVAMDDSSSDRSEEMVEMLPDEHGIKVGSEATAAPGNGPWTEDSSLAGKVLSNTLVGSAAQAALVLKKGELWVSAGSLTQAAAQELAHKISQSWNPYSSSDLARFFRLETTGSEVMLYTTKLGSDLALALVFNPETPFSKMRSQAGALARALTATQEAPQEQIQSPPDQKPEKVNTATEDAQDGSAPVDLPPLFEDIPSPYSRGWKNDALEEIPDVLADTRPVLVGQPEPQQVPSPPSVLIKPSLESAEDLQPASGAISDVNYTCLLIPRLPDHLLSGELSDRLPEWVRQLCLAFGWRLDYLSERPDFLLWIVHVPPTVSPSFVVRMMRQHTSQRIFTRFSALAGENPSGDFWAPGYLVTSGVQPPPAQMISDFIRRTRLRQGTGSPAS
jgi:REP element-mobilizing transposase RayT